MAIRRTRLAAALAIASLALLGPVPARASTLCTWGGTPAAATGGEETAMPFVEIFSQPGTPRPEQRAQIAERLVAEVMAGEGAPDNEFARSISWLVWHDLESWIVGGRTLSSSEPPSYVVRVS